MSDVDPNTHHYNHGQVVINPHAIAKLDNQLIVSEFNLQAETTSNCDTQNRIQSNSQLPSFVSMAEAEINGILSMKENSPFDHGDPADLKTVNTHLDTNIPQSSALLCCDAYNTDTVQELGHSYYDYCLSDASADCLHDQPSMWASINPQTKTLNSHHAGHEINDCMVESDIVFDATMGFDRYNCYSPVIVQNNISCYKDRSQVHYIGGIKTSWNIPAWDHELSFENDLPLKMYVDYAVKNGVLIVDQDASIPKYECRNYLSATSEPAFSFLNDLIHKELCQNRLVLSENTPHCVHAIGAVPKKGGGWRPITDCRRPLGYSINNYMHTTFKEFSFSTVDQVCGLITHGCYMATVDIEAAYRTITISPDHWKYQGLKWHVNGTETYIMDTSLCFGLKCAPYAFNQFSNFIKRCLQRRGIHEVICYLDDYWVKGESFQECQSAQMALIEIMGSLGFIVSFKKCSSPATKVTYLGIEFDSDTMSIALPECKLNTMMEEIRFFHGKSRATIKQLQRICGIISHASKVVKGGRTFSRRMLDLLKGLPATKKRVRLSKEFLKDLCWWESLSATFNGREFIIPYNNGEGISFVTDASGHGYGYVYGDTWRAGYYNSSTLPDGYKDLVQSHQHWKNITITLAEDTNINILELIPVWLCVQDHGAEWSNQHVVCFSDNSQVVSMINKGTSGSTVAMTFIRSIFWSGALNNYHLTARHVRGVDNVVADCLSRIHVKGLSTINDLNLCCSRKKEVYESRPCCH